MRVRGRFRIGSGPLCAVSAIALVAGADPGSAQEIAQAPPFDAQPVEPEIAAQEPCQSVEDAAVSDGAAAADMAEEEQTATPYVMPGTGLEFTLPPAEAVDEAAKAEAGAAPLPQCPPPGPPPPVRPPAPNLFGYLAVPVGSALRGSWDAEKAVSLEGAGGQWNELLLQANAVTGGQPVEMVNRWVNWHLRYVEDRYGDRWSDAIETLQRGYGDCEDFAIAKMALLAKLGIARDDMFLVVLKDRLRAGDHAVLAVRQGDELLVLDNRTDLLRRAEEIDDYVPVLSYSGPFAWTYGRPARAAGAPRGRQLSVIGADGAR